MAHTNQTPNYELSQFLGTDKPAWLVDYNGDMEKIDLGMKAAKDVADAAKEEADQGAIDIAAVTLTADAADAKASGAISDLADAYDSTSTYNIGDYVIYNSILYRCIVPISVPESFDGNHWNRTTIEEIIDGVNNDLDQLNSNLSLKLDKNDANTILENIAIDATHDSIIISTPADTRWGALLIDERGQMVYLTHVPNQNTVKNDIVGTSNIVYNTASNCAVQFGTYAKVFVVFKGNTTNVTIQQYSSN